MGTENVRSEALCDALRQWLEAEKRESEDQMRWASGGESFTYWEGRADAHQRTLERLDEARAE